MAEEMNPLENLRKQETEFLRVLQESVTLSESRLGVDHTGRQNRVLSVFVKMIFHAMSASSVLDRLTDEGTGVLDHYTLAGIVRSMMDTALIIMYMSEPSLTREQWILRRLVIHLHQITNRKRFLEAAEKGQDDNSSGRVPFFDAYAQNKDHTRAQILKVGLAIGLKADDIERLQEGQLVFVNGSRGAAREAGWNMNAYETFQSYYSSYVHSHPVSFMNMDEQGVNFSKPSPFQLNFVTGALDVAARHLSGVNERIRLFTGDRELDPLGQVDVETY